MIDFSCRCGFKLSVPEDLAGGMLQCPGCKLLIDVPRHGQEDELEADGTIKVGESPIQDKQFKERFRRAYELRYDENGELDLRPTMDEIMEAGTEEIPLELADEVRPGAPKYDPETGELIKPMEVKPAVEVPMAQLVPTLDYARADQSPRSPYHTPVGLLLGGNMAALLSLMAVHLTLLLFMYLVAWGFFFVYVIAFFPLLLLLSHYANVVEDVGVMDATEIPTPGRNLSWSEDIFGPFSRLILAALLSWPVLILVLHLMLMRYGLFELLLRWPELLVPTFIIHPTASPMAWLLYLFGAIVFPAVFLTTSTSGAVHNLRPDRVLSVMRICGRMYILAIVLGAVAVPTYWFGFCATSATVMSAAMFGSSIILRVPPAIGFAALFVGIYLMHLFCWCLGLCYRANHEKFPWILQRFISDKKTERRIPPRRPRRRPRAAPAGGDADDVRTPQAPIQPAKPPPIPFELAEGPIPIEPDRPISAESEEGPIPLDPEGPIPIELAEPPIPVEPAEEEPGPRHA